MSLKIEGLQIEGTETCFVRDPYYNPKPEEFTEEDALALITCPHLLEAAKRARINSYTDYKCQKCMVASVEYFPAIRTYQVSGKCPKTYKPR